MSETKKNDDLYNLNDSPVVKKRFLTRSKI